MGVKDHKLAVYGERVAKNFAEWLDSNGIFGSRVDKETVLWIVNGDINNPKTIDELFIKFSEYTCSECGTIITCPFAFDDYNKNDDCLAVK